jgi:DNA polymerase III epsilon subunit-like protein
LERCCHPNAAQVHGYSDSLLARQDPFETYVDEIRSFLCGADLIVAHNSKFDLGFINAELARANRPTIDRSSFCTMDACRELGIRASLDAVSRKLGLARSTRQHGALEDAWLAMMVYLWLHGCPTRAAPFNLVPVTPRWPVGDDRVPANAASNAGRSLAGTTDEAARIDALVEKGKQLKRDHSYEQAEALLLEEVARQEAAARTTGRGVAPWFYEQLAVIYSKQHR